MLFEKKGREEGDEHRREHPAEEERVGAEAISEWEPALGARNSIISHQAVAIASSPTASGRTSHSLQFMESAALYVD